MKSNLQILLALTSIFILTFLVGGYSQEDYNEAEYLYNMGEYEKSIDLIDETIMKNPINREALILKGDALNAKGDKEEAIDLYDKVISIDPENPDAWYKKGMIYYELYQYDNAIECSYELIEINPSNKEAYNLEANAIHKKAEEEGRPVAVGDDQQQISSAYEAAIGSYEKAIEIDSNYTSAWNNKGIILGELSRFNESVACFDEGIRINLSVAEIWNNKGVSLDYWGKHQESLECYDEAVKINPLLAEAWYNKANTLALNLTNYYEAKECFNKSVELNPKLSGEIQPWVYKEMNE
jgi:tetratricopeptide (TPR) repeat protein